MLMVAFAALVASLTSPPTAVAVVTVAPGPVTCVALPATEGGVKVSVSTTANR